ncbi:hypothetical protein ATZ33_01260 [Enterococcus silesiacus]|uniref:Beta-carotene 15,15'-monooxygenase n=1 Tax=Enterococcus silesiacus TaxID=332949 RepID=A0A0S3K6Z5_9ENTE|nr:hypothetical protein [Enterococcus silesiacus]ALS00059.1 hypothetical protein ATZ33_01260 [Enterococcus silesiacus]OJG84822.1 hypothetical protein RV15_GL002885 [Enterococcus silesiacus]
MKKIEDYVNNISFEEAYVKIDRNKIDYLIKGDPDAKFPIRLKKLGFLAISLFMPIMMILSYTSAKDNIVTTVFSRNIAIATATSFILISLFSYFKSRHFLQNYGYKEFIYSSLKILFLSYICGSIGTVDSNYIINLITIIIYVPTCLYLYYTVENNMLIDYINVTFEKEYKTNKILSLLIKMAGIIMILGIVIVQFYRINKSWIDKDSINDSINGLGLSTTLIVIAGAVFMIIISLIPTYISFKADLRIQNMIVTKYSEEFREMYGYYKEEWYGE